MANRTVNINIKYNVNTAEVQRAQAASHAAQKATDDLRRATEGYGKASATAHKQASDASRKAQSETASLTKEFNNLYSTVRLLLTAGLAKELIGASLAMAKLSGTVEGVTKAFNRLPNATLLLESLRKATRGTVNDLELMQRSLMASNFRIPLEKLGTLLEFAAVKAQQTGQEVNHLVNYIISGIGYRSIKRLDDLGFTLNRVREALGGVSLQSASMGEVMEAVTKLMKEDLDKTGGFAETAATKVGQIETAWHELRVALSQKLENTWVLDRYQDFLRGAKDLIEAFPTDKLSKVFTGLNPIKWMGQMTDVIAHWQLGLKDVAENRAILSNAAAEAGRIEKKLSDFTAQERLPLIDEEIRKKQAVADEYFYAIQAADMTIDKFSEENIARKSNIKEIEATIKILQEYRDATSQAIVLDDEQVGIIARKREEIERLQEQIEKTTKAGDLGATGVLTTALKKAQDELADLLGKSKEKTKDAGKEVNDYLAYLSEQELFNAKSILKDKAEQRKRTADEEVRIEKEAKEKREKLAEEEARKMEQLQRDTLALAEEFLLSGLDLALTTQDDQSQRLRHHYDEQIELAGDNERAKKEIRIKAEREIEQAREREKEREKKAASTRILIDGLVAIAKIFGEYGWPAGVVPAAVMAGITATNVAAVRKYNKGGINIPGPGDETSDSIPAMLSKGESVITAQATRRSMGLLEAIQSNKIDDKILKSIDFSGGNRSFNDARMVGKLSSMEAELKGIRKSQYKLEEQGGLLYRVYADDEGNRKRVRTKVGFSD